MRNPSFFDDSPEPAPDAVDPQQLAAQSPWHPPQLPPSGPQSAPTPAGILSPELATLLGAAQSQGPGGGPQGAPFPPQTPPQQTHGLQVSVKPTRPVQALTIPNFVQAITNVIDALEVDKGRHYQNLAIDKGNKSTTGTSQGTNWGISARSFPDVDIKNLTKEGAIDLYQKHWGIFSALADQRVLAKILSLAIDMQMGGHGAATKILQQAINASGGHVPVDGKFGVKTADAANAIDPDVLLKALIGPAKGRYAEIIAKDPTQEKWRKNWNTRAEWMPPRNSSRVPRSNASTQWDAEHAISARERAEAIRSIRNSLAGLSDQPPKTASAPQRKAGAHWKNTPQARAAAVRQARDQQKKKQ